MAKFYTLNAPTRFRLALQHRRSAQEFMFHLGYQGFVPPRILRKLFARSSWHRAWQSGYTGAGILSVLERHAEWEMVLSHDCPQN